MLPIVRRSGAAFAQSIARLHHLSSAAVSTLGKVMLDSTTPPATRVRAADSILDHATKAIEIEDMEARVTDLERAAEQSKSNNGDELSTTFAGASGETEIDT
jgi:hypothetical protein